MNHRARITALTLAIAGFAIAPAAVEAQVTLANVRTRAVIEAIDYQSRALTLRGSQGSLTEHTVPADLQGFNEFQIGDRVTVMFLHELALHLRRPGSAMPDLSEMSAPSGRATEMHTMEAEVTLIDPAVPAISIKSDSGEEATFRLPRGMSLDDFAVGDLMDVTYIIPEVISLANR